MMRKSYSKKNRKRHSRRRLTTTRVVARQEAKRIINLSTEVKMYDGYTGSGATSVSGIDVPTTGITGSFLTDTSAGTSIQRGVGKSDYIGDRIDIVGIQLKLKLERVDLENMVRFIVIQNKGPTSTNTSPANLLQSTGNVATPLSPMGFQFLSDYHKVYDKNYIMDQTMRDTVYVNIYLRKFRKVHFVNAAGLITDGDMRWYFYSDSIAGNPTALMRWRVYYRDA